MLVVNHLPHPVFGSDIEEKPEHPLGKTLIAGDPVQRT
jgi:hypothetical protein